MVGADGRSRAYVNGQAMPVQALRQLGETLVDIHGQMEYQSLMQRAAQRELLDQSGDYRELLDCTSPSSTRAWSDAARRNATAPPRPRRIAKRGWSCCAITSASCKALDLKAGEIEELTAERQRLSQHGRLASGAREILQLLREARRHERRARRLACADSVALAVRARCALRIDRQG